MTAEEFKEITRKWINHKLILSLKSPQWYNQPQRRAALYHVQQKFGAFLQFPKQYPAAQLALFIKRHEDILFAIMPVPHNTAYNQAFITLTELLKKASEIIQEHNLKSIL